MSWNKNNKEKPFNIEEVTNEFHKFIKSETHFSLKVNAKEEGIEVNINGKQADVAMLICLAIRTNENVRDAVLAAVYSYTKNKENG
ncbi:MAG: hypothetical protein ABIW84_10885 [Ilumatobacteraceae bacterium]